MYNTILFCKNSEPYRFISSAGCMPYSADVVIIIFCLLEIRIIASVLEHFFFSFLVTLG